VRLRIRVRVGITLLRVMGGRLVVLVKWSVWGRGRGRSVDEVDVWTSEVDGGKWWCCVDEPVSALDMATYLHRPVMLTMIAMSVCSTVVVI
jgi:hypothetical protein